ncbi:MAG: ABC transporter ATP-binding protein [Planctomycetes bacterium]|nr:ABC transporter ATP-binding protein [Planctomycetota bacterium]
MESPIRAERLTKRYELGNAVVTAVDGLTLDFAAGEFAAVVGRSGSGKSTLLHLLGGLDRPTSGDVAVDGRRLAELSDNELADYRRAKIGFVFQFFNLVPSMTARQNVELPMTLAGADRRARRRRADELLERAGLGARRDHRPSELSGGEQQRVSIARALSNDPPLLLADEPTGNLDSRTAREIMELLKSVGRTLILVTHDRELADAYCRRVIELSDGRVVSDRRGGAS